MTDRIQITANGQPHEADAAQSLPSFIEGLGLPPRQVVVERNGEALTSAEASEVQLQAGDRLEIVRIVAGG